MYNFGLLCWPGYHDNRVIVYAFFDSTFAMSSSYRSWGKFFLWWKPEHMTHDQFRIVDSLGLFWC